MTGSRFVPVVILAIAACVAAPRAGDVRAAAPPATIGRAQDSLVDQPSRQWRTLSSGGFTVVGDASESVLRRTLVELEAFRYALTRLSTVLPVLRYRSPAPLVVVFRSDPALEPYKPRDLDGRRRSNVGGYYFDDPQGAYIVTAADARGGWLKPDVVLHEYAHDVFRLTLGSDLPPWLDEGLAELSASVAMNVSDAPQGRWLGRPLVNHVAALRRAAGPRLAALLATDAARLARMPPDEAALFYARSWALVHYLLLGREDASSDDLPAFLAAVANGQSPVEAFESAFALKAGDMDTNLTGYILNPSLAGLPIAAPGSSAADVKVDAILESEAERIQGNLLLQVRDLGGAGDRLSRAHARNPASTDTRLSLARLRTADLEPETALELLRPIVAGQPATYTTQVVLGRALQRSGRFADALDAFRAATTLATPGIEAWYGMSLTAMLLDRTATADTAMAHLQAVEPAPAWYFERARDLWEAGRDDLALADVRTLLAREVSDVNGRAYAGLIGAVSARRLGDAAAADEILAEVSSNALGRWPTALLAFLCGDLTPDDLLDRARGAGQQTEAHAYVGISASIAGRTDEARRHLTWVRERGVATYPEYDMSRLELARLE